MFGAVVFGASKVKYSTPIIKPGRFMHSCKNWKSILQVFQVNEARSISQ